MNSKNISIGVGVILAVVFGVAFLKQTTVLNQVTVDVPKQSFGAIPGNSIDGNQFCVGGVCKDYYRQTMSNASSTMCAIKTPSATTTLNRFVANITTSTSTAVLGVLATSTRANIPKNAFSAIASTSQITNAVLAANRTDAFVYVPSSFMTNGESLGTLGNYGTASSSSGSLIAPNTYLIFDAQGGGITAAGRGNVFGGGCIVELTEI